MPNFVNIAGSTGFSSAADPVHAIGQQAYTADGRRYRYVLAGELLVAGNALQAPVEDTDHDNITVRATAIGATSLLITTGSGGGALDANEYAGGLVTTDFTTGLGYAYRIKGHAAISASTDGAIELTADDPIQVALTSSSKVTLVKNQYKRVIQMPASTLTNIIVGGCIYPIASGSYGWIQTNGAGASLIEDTPACGQPLTVSDTVGALGVHSAELPNVACMMVTGRDDRVLPVYWYLD